MYAIEVQKLLTQKKFLNHSRDKIKLLNDAITILDYQNDVEWAFELRLELMREELELNSFANSLEAMNWILNMREQEPDLISEMDFLWEYKWMFSNIYTDPTLTEPQRQAIEADYKERLERNGLGSRPIFLEKMRQEVFLGNQEKAQVYKDQFISIERDDMSDCPACETHALVEFHLGFDDVANAQLEAQPIFDKILTCNRIPKKTYASFIMHHLEQKEEEKAQKFYTLLLENDDEVDNGESDLLYSIVGSIFNVKYQPEKELQTLSKFFEWNIDADAFTQLRFFESLAIFLSRYPGEDLSLKIPESYAVHSPSSSYKKQDLMDFTKEQIFKYAKDLDTLVEDSTKNYTQQAQRFLERWGLNA